MMDWEKQQQLPQAADSNHHGGGDGDGTFGGRVTGGNGVPYVKVMTDEQLETLQKQIAIYASICEQLVEMHKNLTAQQDLAGVRLGTLYCDPLVTSVGHKITARQRWTPTPVQLQVLERIFNQGNGTPTKQKIKEMASELSQHGQISETNVYNWFQNRRARSKRKQQNCTSNNGESEAEAEGESQSPKEDKSNPEAFLIQHHNPVPRPEDLPLQSPQISSDLHFVDSPPTKAESLFPSDGSLRPETRSFGHMAYYDDMLSHSGNGHLTGKMEVPGGYNLYEHADDYTV